ncbi:MAG: indolepyruvate ferredoxin oxidoreductase subunit beta [Deferrisomatales bacterium]
MNYQIVVAGIGGQGTLFATRIFTEIARLRHLPVIGSENHGMSQRGGSVVSHLKLGTFHSPLVSHGQADLLLGIDPVEAHRNLPFVGHGPGALCVVNASEGRRFPHPDMAGLLEARGVEVLTCPADALALEAGSALAANLVLLGLATTDRRFPFGYEEVREAVQGVSAAPYAQVNLDALARGRGWATRQG